MTGRRTESRERGATLIGRAITTIAPAGGKDQRLKVCVGRRVAARLRRRDVEELCLAPGRVIDAALLEAIGDRELVGRAIDAAARWLARRPLARAVLADRLAERGFEPDVVSRALVRLTEAGLIDDEAIGHDIIEQAKRRGPAGLPFLRHALERRGIAPELAERIARQAAAQSDPEGEARRFIAKRLALMGRVPPATQTRRLLGLLARRGIDQETAARLVREAVPEEGRVGESY